MQLHGTRSSRRRRALGPGGPHACIHPRSCRVPARRPAGTGDTSSIQPAMSAPSCTAFPAMLRDQTARCAATRQRRRAGCCPRPSCTTIRRLEGNAADRRDVCHAVPMDRRQRAARSDMSGRLAVMVSMSRVTGAAASGASGTASSTVACTARSSASARLAPPPARAGSDTSCRSRPGTRIQVHAAPRAPASRPRQRRPPAPACPAGCSVVTASPNGVSTSWHRRNWLVSACPSEVWRTKGRTLFGSGAHIHGNSDTPFQ